MQFRCFGLWDVSWGENDWDGRMVAAFYIFSQVVLAGADACESISL
jgi:hypothetical protein